MRIAVPAGLHPHHVTEAEAFRRVGLVGDALTVPGRVPAGDERLRRAERTLLVADDRRPLDRSVRGHAVRALPDATDVRTPSTARTCASSSGVIELLCRLRRASVL